MINSLIGNPLAKRALLKMVAQSAVPNTLLFYGAEGVGKKQFAIALAELLMGKAHAHKLQTHNHPDLHLYFPEGKSFQHPIENMRQLIDEVALPPFEAPVKVFILEDAHLMHTFSSNALLKTLEEPPPDTYLILLTPSIDAMLPTILSRSRKVPFFSIPQTEMETFVKEKWQKKEEEAKRIAFLAHGSLAKAKQLATSAELPFRKPLLEILALSFPRDYPQFAKHMTALDAVLEPEEEDAAAFPTDLLFEEILAWYRDLHLIKEGVALEYIYHLDQMDSLRLSAAGPIPPLERLLEKVAQARLGLQRSMKLRNVLEHFFLS